MTNPSMPDFLPPSDDDEVLEPWFNDQGSFGDIQDLIFPPESNDE